LSKSGIYLCKFKGQHLLTSKSLLSFICRAGEVSPLDGVIEIGTGLGALTEKLIKLAGKVVSIEKEEAFRPLLNQKFKEATNLILLFGDALKINWEEFLSTRTSWKLIANIPYYITKPLLKLLIKYRDRFSLAVLLLQKEVAEKIKAPVGGKNYGAFTIYLNYYWHPRVLRLVSPQMFLPPPRVYSAVVRFDKKTTKLLSPVEEDMFFSFVYSCFSSRRKTLVNNLFTVFKGKIRKEELENLLKGLGFSPKVRAQELSLEDFVKLYRDVTLCSKPF